jgi:hypothetical protein
MKLSLHIHCSRSWVRLLISDQSFRTRIYVYLLGLWTVFGWLFDKRRKNLPKLYRMFQEERSVFWEVIVSFILREKKCIFIYIRVLFRTVSEIRAVSLHSSLAPNTVLSSRMWIGGERQLAVVTVDVDVACGCVVDKCRTSSQMPNMLICCILSSHELQSALMLTVEFSKMYFTR